VKGVKLANVLTRPSEGLADIVGDIGCKALLQHVGLINGGIREMKMQEQNQRLTDMHYNSPPAGGNVQRGQQAAVPTHQSSPNIDHAQEHLRADSI
jgi:hypothetical protein